jgi:hypothetical protein
MRLVTTALLIDSAESRAKEVLGFAHNISINLNSLMKQTKLHEWLKTKGLSKIFNTKTRPNILFYELDDFNFIILKLTQKYEQVQKNHRRTTFLEVKSMLNL